MTAGEKHLGRFAAYYRVSTRKQEVSGLGLDAQRAIVQRHLDGGRHTVKDFVETESGKNTDRPQLRTALHYCRIHRATLIVAKLDRLTRNAAFLRTVEKECDAERGVIFCDLPNVPTGAAGKFIVSMLAAAAELEAGLTSERTKAALAEKKKALALEGKRLGTPYPDKIKAYAHAGAQASATTRGKRAARRAEDLRPVIEEIRKKGATTLRAIADALNAEEHQAPRGGQWHAASVARILA